MIKRSPPVTANYRLIFFDNTSICSFHTIKPTCFIHALMSALCQFYCMIRIIPKTTPFLPKRENNSYESPKRVIPHDISTSMDNYIFFNIKLSSYHQKTKDNNPNYHYSFFTLVNNKTKNSSNNSKNKKRENL